MIVEVNLLPKRYRKADKRFQFGKAEIVTFSMAAAIVLAMAGITWNQGRVLTSLDNDIVEARKRTQALQRDIQIVDGLMDMKQKIAERMQAVEQLDRHRSSWVRILEDISGRVPDFVWLGSFQEIDPTKSTQRVDKPVLDSAEVTESGLPIRPIEVEGYSFTLNALAAFMIKLMRSDFFDDVDMVYARELELGQKRAYEFKIQGRLHYLSDEELRSMLAAERDIKAFAKR